MHVFILAFLLAVDSADNFLCRPRESSPSTRGQGAAASADWGGGGGGRGGVVLLPSLLLE
jgi:hypothetical protein